MYTVVKDFAVNSYSLDFLSEKYDLPKSKIVKLIRMFSDKTKSLRTSLIIKEKLTKCIIRDFMNYLKSAPEFAEEYGMTRDQLYFKLKEANVLGRRYFYPLISTFEPYRTLPSSAAENLPVATRIADEVICLPMHHELSESDVERVLDIMMK